MLRMDSLGAHFNRQLHSSKCSMHDTSEFVVDWFFPKFVERKALHRWHITHFFVGMP